MTERVIAPLVTISEVAPSVESLKDSVNENDGFKNSKLQIDRKFQQRESILSSEISLFIEKTSQKIPDGGWGWLIVFAAFIINMLSDGIAFTFGLLYIEFLEEFKASRSATSWIGSLFMALPLIAGPIGSALVDKYGCRSMTMVGGIVCTIGLVASSYARSIGVMYFTFGVIGGLGLTLGFVTAVVSIAFWFEKKRTIALGLAASGTGFGTAVYSPLATWLLFEYGWRGTVLITAGFFANMCVCGALMRDPDWIIEEDKKEKQLKKEKRRKSSASSIDTECLEEIKHTLEGGGDTNYLLEDVDATLDLTDKDRFASVVDLPTFVRQNEEVPLEVLKQLSENKQIYSIILENYPNLLSVRSSSETRLNMKNGPEHHNSRVPVRFLMKVKKAEDVPTVNIDVEANTVNELEVPTSDVVIGNSKENNANVPCEERQMLNVNNTFGPSQQPNKGIQLLRSLSVKAKTQMQPQSYLKKMRFRKNSIGYRGAMLNIHKYKMKASSCPDIYKNSMSTLWREEEFFRIAEHMGRNGYTEAEASLAISIIGITNTVGMVLLGIVGDRINIAKAYAVCLILCGVTIAAMMIFTSNYYVLLISGGGFGLFFASSMSLTPSLLSELVSLDDFTMAYGLLLLSEGIGTLIGPPLAGWIFDLTQSWEQSFYQAAFWIVISGVLIAIIPCTRNRTFFSSN